jgi:hypothetical protein
MSNVPTGQPHYPGDGTEFRRGQIAAYEAILRELAELSARVRVEVARLTLPQRTPRPRIGDER